MAQLFNDVSCSRNNGPVYLKPTFTGGLQQLDLAFFTERLQDKPLEVRFIDDVHGKGLFATAAIPKGTVIHEESPLAVAQYLWNKKVKYRACDNCMYPLETAEEMAYRLSGGQELRLPFLQECCPNSNGRADAFVNCSICGEEYCCQQCMAEAAVYHRFLCVPRELRASGDDTCHPLLHLEYLWRELHPPPESASIILLVKMLARAIAKMEAGWQKTDALRELFRFTSLEDVQGMEYLAKFSSSPEYTSRLDEVADAFRIVISHHSIDDCLTREGFRSLFVLMCVNAQGVGTSSLDEYGRRLESLSPSAEKEEATGFLEIVYEAVHEYSACFQLCEGSALYAIQSCLNHSCEPNAEISFPYNNSKLVVTTLKDIHPGEEVCISYLDAEDLRRKRRKRQRSLQEYYLFHCHCPRCLREETEEPDGEEESEDSDDGEEEEEEEGEGMET